MIEIPIRLRIDARPEHVFDALADVRNEEEWNPVAKSVTKTSDGPIGRDATFTAQYAQGVGEVEMRIVEYDRPRRMRIAGGSRMMTFTFEAEVLPEGDGARVSGTMQAEPRGMGKVMAPLMRLTLPRSVRKSFAGFQRFAEARLPRAEPAGEAEAAGTGERGPAG